jgi:two-component system, cell cycle sensor histidine kinase and response regulator CckA
MHLGRYLALTVRDNGPGMSDKVRQRIFEPFFTTKENSQGTGIGLATMCGIVKGHEGGIAGWSKPGKGSVFRVFLPLIEVMTQKDETSNVGGNERILFVDDEEALVEPTTMMLCRLGHKATGSSDPRQALKHFSANADRFDLILKDYGMPNMTGLSLAERLMAVRPDVPVIVVTGNLDEPVTPDKARDSGIREFVMKPVAISESTETIQRVLNR